MMTFGPLSQLGYVLRGENGWFPSVLISICPKQSAEKSRLLFTRGRRCTVDGSAMRNQEVLDVTLAPSTSGMINDGLKAYGGAEALGCALSIARVLGVIGAAVSL
jgi:hypothetical protein